MRAPPRNRCSLCGHGNLRGLYSAKGYQICTCLTCDFAQVSEVPTDAELGALYEALHHKHLKFRSETAALIENKRRFDLLERWAEPGARVLDAGCATGDFLAIAKSNYNVYGLDISEGAVEHARQRLPDLSERLRTTPLEHLADFDRDWRQFDAVCLWDVIEHVREPRIILTGLMDLIKPGGYLIFSTPDISSFTARIMRKHWAFMIPPYHLGYFGRKSTGYLTRSILHHADLVHYETRGKKVDLAFLLYKLNQMSKRLMPNFVMNSVAAASIGKLRLYIPTNDIMYVVIQKKPEISSQHRP